MVATSDFTGHSDRFGDYSGASERKLVYKWSHPHTDAVVSGESRSAKMALLARHHARSAAEEKVVPGDSPCMTMHWFAAADGTLS